MRFSYGLHSFKIGTQNVEIKMMKNIFQANANPKKVYAPIIHDIIWSYSYP